MCRLLPYGDKGTYILVPCSHFKHIVKLARDHSIEMESKGKVQTRSDVLNEIIDELKKEECQDSAPVEIVEERS